MIAIGVFDFDVGLSAVEGVDGEGGVTNAINARVAEVGVAERSVDE